jgi:hypothetical protein
VFPYTCAAIPSTVTDCNVTANFKEKFRVCNNRREITCCYKSRQGTEVWDGDSRKVATFTHIYVRAKKASFIRKRTRSLRRYKLAQEDITSAFLGVQVAAEVGTITTTSTAPIIAVRTQQHN